MKKNQEPPKRATPEQQAEDLMRIKVQTTDRDLSQNVVIQATHQIVEKKREEGDK